MYKLYQVDLKAREIERRYSDGDFDVTEKT